MEAKKSDRGPPRKTAMPGVRGDAGALSRRSFVVNTAKGITTLAIGGAVFDPDIAMAAAPVWRQIPDQNWQVGKSVFLDLSDYVSDSDGDALLITLDADLPAGVRLNGSIISGVPTAEFSATNYVATAEDGNVIPKPPADLQGD